MSMQISQFIPPSPSPCCVYKFLLCLHLYSCPANTHPIQIALPQTVTREMVYSPHSFSRLKHSHTTSPARLTTFKDFR